MLVGPDQGPNCFERLLADDKGCHSQKKKLMSWSNPFLLSINNLQIVLDQTAPLGAD